MAKNKKERDPLPDEFPSWREAAEFWDTHDTGDYPEAWIPLDETIEFVEEPSLQVKLSPRLARELQQHARQKRVSVEILVNRLLEVAISEQKISHRIADRSATYRKKSVRRK
jgi:hypothetical protein